mgnify:CR=1 FL=1|jgi:adenine-specific DNA-methyltransferase
MELNEFEEYLGKPSCRGEGYMIFNGDCLELLAKLPLASIPLFVTSPPYNIGKEYESIIGIDRYLDWCQQWIGMIHKATSNNGAFWLNLGYLALEGRAKAIPIPYLLWDRVPFYLLQEVVWNYAAGVASKKAFSPRNEKLLWYIKNEAEYVFDLDAVRDPNVKYPNQKKNGKLKCNPLGKNPTDVWQIAKVTSGQNRSSKERTPHPAQFPIEMITRIIKACSLAGDVVLDPFLGSGSTIEAALRSGRQAIGFEINPSYVSIAEKRIQRVLRTMEIELAQGKLF